MRAVLTAWLFGVLLLGCATPAPSPSMSPSLATSTPPQPTAPPTLGVGGYSAFYPTEQGDEWRAEAGFLEGACGIALALKAAIGTRAPDWDSVLGLSAPLVASSGLTVDTTRANARG